MDITKHVDSIAGFVEAYEEVYESVLKKQKNTENTAFSLMRAQNVVKEFEQKYDVELLHTNTALSGVSDMVFAFDTVNFKTAENQTMCLLKWT
jgi:thiamine pyrophosphokinase